ncbi:MAG: isoprenylcysteine carboxylmethyltransferase family protein [Actinomycetia bacterium]|nr:isoprenylcysteine carboxylmethyltransferase family protein [Actinomycetes bacterium]
MSQEIRVNQIERSRPSGPGSRLRHQGVAWSLVGVQAALIIGILLTPTGNDWSLSPAAAAFATALTWLGLGLVVWAVLVFGRGVTPSPMPSRKARLRTRGPYRWIRHPMYTGVITLMAGSALGRRNWIAAALWVVLVVFFITKIRWEERRLVEAYPGYRSYREAVPALVPFGPRAAPAPGPSPSS